MPHLHAPWTASALLVLAATNIAPSQTPVADVPPKAKTEARWVAAAAATAGYDSNVFRLSDRSRDRLQAERPADAVSERFRDMKSVDDFVLDVELTVTRKATGYGGRDLDFTLGVGADLHATNTIKNSPHVALAVIQDLAKGAELRGRLRYDYGRFRRNYLYDATDLTGNVNASERVFRSGKFNELGAAGEYRFRLWREKKKKKKKKKKKRPTGIASWIGLRELECRTEVGFARRDYDNFANRDRNMVHGELTLVSRLGKDWRLDLSYHGRYIDTPGGTEILVLDEPDFGVDFNNDGDALDQNRRTSQRVDRDRLDQRLAAELRWQPAKRWESRLGYEFLRQDYFSKAPFDLNNNGRLDERHQITGRLAYRMAKRAFAEARVAWMDERSDRRIVGDEDEESSYGRWQAFLAVTIRF